MKQHHDTVTEPASLEALRMVTFLYAAVALIALFALDLTIDQLLSASHWRFIAMQVPAALCIIAGAILAYQLSSRMAAALDATREREQQARHELTLNAQLLRTLTDHSPDAIFAKRRDGGFLLLNRAAESLFGAAATVALGADGPALVRNQAAIVRELEQRVMEREQPATTEDRVEMGGAQRVLRTTEGPLRVGDEVIGLFSIARDITELADARAKLLDNELRCRQLFDAHPLPAWVIDATTLHFLDVNAAAVEHFGHTYEAMLQMSLTELYVGETRENHTRCLLRCADGRQVDTRVSASEVFDVEGRRARLMFALDTTDGNWYDTSASSPI